MVKLISKVILYSVTMGEYNKMYNFTIAEAVDAYNVKEKATIAYQSLIGKTNENNNIQ
jgi:hypothetical protein